MPNTDAYESLFAETIKIEGDNGDLIRAYIARPMGEGPFPAVLLIDHAPGWDAWYRETTLKFARNGYIAISPNLYERAGHGSAEDVGAMVRSGGGVPDAQVIADCEGAIRYVRAMPQASGKIGVFGTCSGGRHSMLVASHGSEPVDAVMDLWGGAVVMKAEDLTEKRPVSPSDYTANLTAPVLGLFGNDDRAPAPEQVDEHEALLKQHGKKYEFHRYDGAGHGFFYYDRPAYRQEQAVDGWNKLWDFLGRTLA